MGLSFSWETLSLSVTAAIEGAVLFQIHGGDVGQVAAFLVYIQAVADHEVVGDLEAQVINLDIYFVAGFFIQQGADFEAARLAFEK